MSAQASSSESLGKSPVFNLVGVSHRTLALQQREALARAEFSSAGLLRSIAQRCSVEELAILSTCNRFEVLSAGRNAEKMLVDFISSQTQQPLPREAIYSYKDTEAFRHLFRVAASLDSMVIGEAQILGQIKEAYRSSVRSGCAGKYLHHLFQSAFRLAKRVRTNTGVAEKGVSLSYVAVKLAQQIFGELNGRSVMIIGSGQMAELAAVHLKSYGCSNLIVANRTAQRAAELASRIGGSSISLFEIENRLPDVDMIIGSISIDRPLLKIGSVKRYRRTKPLFLIDLGVPRNFSPALAELDNVYLYNIDDLAAIAERNSELRTEAARDAEVIIEYGVQQFEKWLQRIAVEPQIVDFRRKIASLCSAELRLHLERHLSNEQLEQILPLIAHRLSQKTLHELTEVIAGMGCRELDDISLVACLCGERSRD